MVFSNPYTFIGKHTESGEITSIRKKDAQAAKDSGYILASPNEAAEYYKDYAPVDRDNPDSDFNNPDKIPVRNRDGDIGTIDRSELNGGEISNGYTRLTSQEAKYAIDEEKYSGFMEGVKAFGTSAVDELTLGTYKHLLDEDTVREIEEREEHSPIASGIGTAGGILAPALLSGGGSVGIKAGASGIRGIGKLGLGRAIKTGIRHTPAGLLMRGGLAAERSALSGAKGVAKRAAIKGTVGAAEGAIYTGTRYVNEAALDSTPDFTASGLIDYAGMGAIGGGVGAGTFSLGGAALGGATRKAIAGSKKLASKMPAFSDWAERTKTRVSEFYLNKSSKLTGEAVEDLKTIFTKSDLDDNQFRKVFAGIPNKKAERIRSTIVNMTDDDASQVAVNIKKSIEDMDENLSKQYSEFRKRRPAELEAATAGIDPSKPFQTLNDIKKKFERVIHELDKPNKYISGNKAKKNLKNLYNSLLIDISNAQGKPTVAIIDLIEDYKNKLYTIAEITDKTKKNRNKVLKIIGSLSHEVRTTLEDESVYGPAAVFINKTNAAQSDWFNSKRFFEKAFTTTTKTGPRIDNKKIIRFFKKYKELGSEIDKEKFDDYVLNSKKLAEALDGHGAPDPISLAARVDINDTLDSSYKIIDQYNYMKGMKQSKFGESPLGTPGTLIGGAALGGFGGIGDYVLTGAAAVAKAAKLARDPVGTSQIISSTSEVVRPIIEATERMARTSSGAIKSFFSKAKGLKPNVNIRTGILTAGAIDKLEWFESKNDPSKNNFERISNEINRLSKSPEIIDANIKASLSAITGLLPKTIESAISKSKLANAFLLTKLPKIVQPDPLNPNYKIMPTKLELAKFERYVAAINKPTIVFKDLKNGIVNVEGFEALREVYPEIYNGFKDQVIEYLADNKDIPYQKRQKIYYALGITEDVLPRMQSLYGEEKPKEKPKAKGGKAKSPKLRQNTVDAISEDQQTEIQRVTQ